jgi:nephrocystin-3
MSGNSKLINRSIRVFVSSTFRDMVEERDLLMTHTWPELRRYCRERQVEFIEVDLRWGVSEEQSTRKETLKLCLDEIRACRPFFIGLLGERYGWIPDDNALTDDLKEEQPWLKDMHGKSVTELEILHGVLNNPEMAGRAFFYFRDPKYAENKGVDYLSDNIEIKKNQIALKNLIRKTCLDKKIPLHENYSSPQELAQMVLRQLKDAIEVRFPIVDIPDPMDREALDHEDFAEIRRRTYIGRPDYFIALDDHCNGVGAPLLLLGDSGSGKSSLFANWVEHWRKEHPKDFIFQHYIGATPESSNHWMLLTRLMKEIKRWTEDDEKLPSTNDDILRDLPGWLFKARSYAEKCNSRFIIILDALNQLDDIEHGRLFGWLPESSFSGALRLMVSTLQGETLQKIEKYSWSTLHIQPLSPDERQRMIIDYLQRFGKKLNPSRLDRLSTASSTANPLYLKILLDELRVTGTYDRLDERLSDYLHAMDIPSLLQKVLTRYQHDYEYDREGLVGKALGLIWSARRGLTETELLRLLRPENLPQLPIAIWAPLRAVLEESLVDRAGVLNFAHDFLRSAVETLFLPTANEKKDLKIKLAYYFEAQPPTYRTCDELPWLLWQIKDFERLRKYLLNIDCFIEIDKRDEEELRKYWVGINEEKIMGKAYSESYMIWLSQKKVDDRRILSEAANRLGSFLYSAGQFKEAEECFQLSLIVEQNIENRNPLELALYTNNLAGVYVETDRISEAEPLFRQALQVNEQILGKDHPRIALYLNNLAMLLKDTNHLDEAESLLRRALEINEQAFGKDHPNVARNLHNLAMLFKAANRINEMEPLMLQSLKIFERRLGENHPNVATSLDNLAQLLTDTDRLDDAESLLKRALEINEQSFGLNHPNVSHSLNSIAEVLLKDADRRIEAEPLLRRALEIDELNYGKDSPKTTRSLNNLGALCQYNNRPIEAESLYLKSLKIGEESSGKDSKGLIDKLNNLATLYFSVNRLSEAEPLMKRGILILIENTRSTGYQHPLLIPAVNNYSFLLKAMGWGEEQIHTQFLNMGLDI